MSRIRGKDSKPELIVRKALFSAGIRYRLHSSAILGHPDVSIAKYKIALFVNGCFWHGHQGCRYAYVPKSNTKFWTSKIERNRSRDVAVHLTLEKKGWLVLDIWECDLKHHRDEIIQWTVIQIQNRINVSRS